MTKSAIQIRLRPGATRALCPCCFGSGFCALIYQPGRYTAEALQPKR